MWNGIPAEVRPKDGDGFAQALVAAGKLTKFQAQELFAGRGGALTMGDYVLLAEIGVGGMGKVYQAQHRRMKRVVALKVMSSAAMQDDAAGKRFQRDMHPIEYHRRHHVALVRDATEYRLYVNGRKIIARPIAKPDGPQPAHGASPLHIGGDGSQLQLDEIRVSQVY